MALNESYWTYRVERADPHAPAELNMPDEEWAKLSPGMRREITRSYSGQSKLTPPTGAPTADPKQARRDRRDRKAAVEHAARKRL